MSGFEIFRGKQKDTVCIEVTLDSFQPRQIKNGLDSVYMDSVLSFTTRKLVQMGVRHVMFPGQKS